MTKQELIEKLELNIEESAEEIECFNSSDPDERYSEGFMEGMQFALNLIKELKG